MERKSYDLTREMTVLTKIDVHSNVNNNNNKKTRATEQIQAKNHNQLQTHGTVHSRLYHHKIYSIMYMYLIFQYNL